MTLRVTNRKPVPRRDHPSLGRGKALQWMFTNIASLVSVLSGLSLLGFSRCGVAAEEQLEAIKQRIPSIQGHTRGPEKTEKAREKSKRRERKLKLEGSVDLKDFFGEWASG